MAQVVLSYARETKEFVSKLALALKTRGLDVWYDHDLMPGDDYSNKIDEQIITAAAVIVVWSQPASKSRWVKAEASRAGYDKLLQVMCERCTLPLPFNSIHCEDLSGWNGGASAPEIDKIVAAVGVQIERSKSSEGVVDDTPDEDLPEVRRILDDQARIKVARLIARGEISKIYLGGAGTRIVAIKALSGDKLSAEDRKELGKEVELSSYLQHPTFLRIYGVLFPGSRCFIVSDFFEGQTIAQRLRQGTAYSVEDVIGIMQQLSAATAEAHARGMQYVRMTPSDVLVRVSKVLDRQIARIAPFNLKYFMEYHRMGQEVLWRNDTAPFTAPELWNDPTWVEEGVEANLDQEWVRALHHKANQFALGMVAWTMMEGKLPIAIPQRGIALTKIKAFLEASQTFPERVLASAWRANARALAGIVARMVAADPRQRWDDMREVNDLIGTLAADQTARELNNGVKTAYNELCRGNPQFCERFYANFFRRAPQARAKFPVDMPGQQQMLDFLLEQLLNYRQKQAEPTTLTQFVERHADLGLSADDFIQFGEALVEAFEAALKKDAPKRNSIIAALEIIVWPGIHYLIDKCVPARVERAALSA